jgi:hypothetical protein
MIERGFNQRARRASLMEAKAVSRRGSLEDVHDESHDKKTRNRSKSLVARNASSGMMLDLETAAQRWDEEYKFLKAKILHYQSKIDHEQQIYDMLAVRAT